MIAESQSLWLPAKSKIHSYTYSWTIPDVTKNRLLTEQFSSPRIKMVLVGEREGYFFLRLMISENSSSHLALTLSNITGSKAMKEISNVRYCEPRDDISCTAWIFGKHKQCISRLHVSSGALTPTAGCGRYLSQLVARDTQFVTIEELFNEDLGLLRDNSLTIVCQVNIAMPHETALVDSWLFDTIQPVIVPQTRNSLNDDLLKLLKKGSSSDVRIVAEDGCEFSAHTLMLSSRSPVFDAMFQHDMKESREKRVELKDVSSATVADLLQFMYTDKAQNLDTLAPELLAVAHRYNIPKLKSICEEQMAKSMTVQNAAEYLSAADLYEASELLKVAKHFVARNLGDVKKTEAWKTMCAPRLHVVDEVLDELADVMRKLTA